MSTDILMKNESKTTWKSAAAKKKESITDKKESNNITKVWETEWKMMHYQMFNYTLEDNNGNYKVVA